MKRKLLYLYIKLKRGFFKTYKPLLSTKELRARRLAMYLIHAKDSTLLLCPITYTRYIVNERCDMGIVIRPDSVDFYGEVEHSIKFCAKNYYQVQKEFDKVAALDREELEKSFKRKLDDSFNEMYKKVIK